ncbi:MAG: tRNA (N6-isopentenyl adenosine(37)-C2)-methylthiotransferase MiaB [Alphaproteobacteria bacterium]|nr:tRNA (N6-isopentenyl adenosine(37)-C2)-methylthiotransferase MiaB [Alphaproteobacteria bacterium]NDC55687.1 tRNA (N6-isopentenyl adenosine(37)-C2)-methylthiotransferase MiaB [Alphaproteobacteria bacterium]NDG04000.1 tRNA (N6-isopentenyl adenosine(37)-C2)-methylthiotransferase MiaB [Alphaproteobacteria bacterium]
MQGKRHVYVKNWGCQMNVYDGQKMVEVLAPLGYAPTEDAESADLIILNTCHIREKATEKLFSELGRMRAHQKKRESLIAVAGCVAQAEGAEIKKRAPYVNMVFGPQTYHRLPQMIAEVHRAGGFALDTDFPAESKFDHLPIPQSKADVAAFLTVQEGCDKFCTFCVVPYTRGAETSRPVADVVREAENLAKRGAREITLLGQNVNAYHGRGPDDDEWSLARLLSRLAEIDGVQRLRFVTSHPREMTNDLIAEFGKNPKIMPYLHLPLQSGSDEMLQAMNRKHTVADYERTIDQLRRVQPHIALSSDFIVGFPGENDVHFEETMQTVRRIGFASAYSFQYSARPGTPAALMDAQVPDPVKEERLQRLQELLRQQTAAFNDSMVGKTVPVLFDRPGHQPGQHLGRSPWLQPVHVTSPLDLHGKIVDTTIVSANATSLGGEVG